MLVGRTCQFNCNAMQKGKMTNDDPEAPSEGVVLRLVAKLRVWQCMSSGKLRFAEGAGAACCRRRTGIRHRHNDRKTQSIVNLAIDIRTSAPSNIHKDAEKSSFIRGHEPPPSTKRSFPKEGHCQTLSLATRPRARWSFHGREKLDDVAQISLPKHVRESRRHRAGGVDALLH